MNSINADVLPFEYNGVSIVPLENTHIRLRSETVTIDLYPIVKNNKKIYMARVKALFYLENLSPKRVTLNVGFPLDSLEIEFAQKEGGIDSLYNFNVKVNGYEVDKILVINSSHDNSVNYGVYSLFGWENDFLPGSNIIEVEYRIYSNYSYDYCYQNIHYILSSGCFWEGKIDSAKIIVNCPQKIVEEQIMPHTKPANYILCDRSIIWYFRDFEPTENENIEVELMPFDLYDNIDLLRRKVANNPADDRARMSLASLYLSTGMYRGLLFYVKVDKIPSNSFEKDILRNISNKNDKMYLLRHYVKNETIQCYVLRKCAFEDYWKIVEILNSIDYRPIEYPDYFLTARKLLDEIINRDPYNADAWILYFAYFKKMALGEYSPSSKNISVFLKQRIEEAYRYCPNDIGIRYWFESITDSIKVIPEKMTIRGSEYQIEHLSGESYSYIDAYFVKGECSVPFTMLNKEIRKLFKYYDRSSVRTLKVTTNNGTSQENEYDLILKKRYLSNKHKLNLVDIITRSSSFFRTFYSDKLNEYYRSKDIFSNNCVEWR